MNNNAVICFIELLCYHYLVELNCSIVFFSVDQFHYVVVFFHLIPSKAIIAMHIKCYIQMYIF